MLGNANAPKKYVFTVITAFTQTVQNFVCNRNICLTRTPCAIAQKWKTKNIVRYSAGYALRQECFSVEHSYLKQDYFSVEYSLSQAGNLLSQGGGWPLQRGKIIKSDINDLLRFPSRENQTQAHLNVVLSLFVSKLLWLVYPIR